MSEEEIQKKLDGIKKRAARIKAIEEAHEKRYSTTEVYSALGETIREFGWKNPGDVVRTFAKKLNNSK